MRRILIALEDFSDLRFCETVLKKIGFDTQSSQTEMSVATGILSFNPDLLIMTAAGTRVNGINYLSKLKQKNKGLPVVLVGARSRLNVSDKQIVALLEPPLSPRILIEVLSSQFGLNEESLISKYEKTSEFKEQKDSSTVRVTGGDTEVSMRMFVEKNRQSPDRVLERERRYKELAIRTELPPFKPMTRALVQDQVKDFRMTENDEAIRKIDEERRLFAIELGRRVKRP